MILHELATNAVKHGALSSPQGHVRIRSELGDDAWRLRWTEPGGPAVTPPSRTGFGTRLITRLAAELGGVIEVDWRPGGVVVELTVRVTEDLPDGSHPFIGAVVRMRRRPSE